MAVQVTIIDVDGDDVTGSQPCHDNMTANDVIQIDSHPDTSE